MSDAAGSRDHQRRLALRRPRRHPAESSRGAGQRQLPADQLRPPRRLHPDYLLQPGSRGHRTADQLPCDRPSAAPNPNGTWSLYVADDEAVAQDGSDRQRLVAGHHTDVAAPDTSITSGPSAGRPTIRIRASTSAPARPARASSAASTAPSFTGCSLADSRSRNLARRPAHIRGPRLRRPRQRRPDPGRRAPSRSTRRAPTHRSPPAPAEADQRPESELRASPPATAEQRSNAASTPPPSPPAASPQSFSGLSATARTPFAVRAADDLENVDPTPAERAASRSTRPRRTPTPRRRRDDHLTAEVEGEDEEEARHRSRSASRLTSRPPSDARSTTRRRPLAPRRSPGR